MTAHPVIAAPPPTVRVTLAIKTQTEGTLARRIVALAVPEPNTGCWLWTGYVMKNGYGTVFVRRGHKMLAHRASYEVFVGAIPPGFTIDHRCRQTSCVNPEHLDAVTQSENNRRSLVARDGHRHSKQTHCAKGHEYDEGNTLYVRKILASGRESRQRRCRICAANWWRSWSARHPPDKNANGGQFE